MDGAVESHGSMCGRYVWQELRYRRFCRRAGTDSVWHGAIGALASLGAGGFLARRDRSAMDIVGFHERMQKKYIEREQLQRRHDRLVRILVMGAMALIAFSLVFVLAYLWYTGKL